MEGLWIGVGITLAATALLGVFVAVQKRRSPAEGLILGVLFGPLGVLVEALLPSPEAGPAVVPKGRTPKPARTRMDITSADVRVVDPRTPAGWEKYRRATTNEVFYVPAEPPRGEPKRWEKPLRRIDGEG